MKYIRTKSLISTTVLTLFGSSFLCSSAQAITITGTTDANFLAETITEGALGIEVTGATLSGNEVGNAVSSGIYTNETDTYGIGPGVVFSSGDVNDYNDGPNNSGSNTTGYGSSATPAQEALLDPITGGNFNHRDVTQFDIFFDTTDDSDQIAFNVVFGSEEYPEFVNTNFIDGFGLFTAFVNEEEVNIAKVFGLPVNINHPDFAFIPGTELDGVLAPDGNPVLTFITDVPPNTQGNKFTFIVADTSDSALDTTIYVSNFSGEGGNEFLPILPTSIAEDGAFIFENVAGGQLGAWYDPPFVNGFTYTMLDDNLFTEILNFPSIPTDPMEVVVGGVSQGFFQSGDSFTFPGNGVSEFQILGITPPVDVENQLGFPLQLAFNNDPISFQMKGIENPDPTDTPEPGSLFALLGLGFFGFKSLKKKA